MMRTTWTAGLLAAGAALAAGGSQAQTVWKCVEAGQVRFSDQPCPDKGEAAPGRRLQPNVVDSPRMPPAPAAAAVAAPPAAAAGPEPNACPGDGEIRNMETRANSTTLGDAERRFMQDEVRRAWQCRKGQGRYTEADWAISREAQAAQTQFSDRARQSARERAEAMHSAADAAEGDRIQRRQLAEERMRRDAERAAERANAPPRQNPPSSAPR